MDTTISGKDDSAINVCLHSSIAVFLSAGSWTCCLLRFLCAELWIRRWEDWVCDFGYLFSLKRPWENYSLHDFWQTILDSEQRFSKVYRILFEIRKPSWHTRENQVAIYEWYSWSMSVTILDTWCFAREFCRWETAKQINKWTKSTQTDRQTDS